MIYSYYFEDQQLAIQYTFPNDNQEATHMQIDIN